MNNAKQIKQITEENLAKIKKEEPIKILKEIEKSIESSSKLGYFHSVYKFTSSPLNLEIVNIVIEELKKLQYTIQILNSRQIIEPETFNIKKEIPDAIIISWGNPHE